MANRFHKVYYGFHEKFYPLMNIFSESISHSGEQEEHIPILEMALAVKYITRIEKMASTQTKDINNVKPDDVIIELTADLQQIQDEETKSVVEMLPEMVFIKILWLG